MVGPGRADVRRIGRTCGVRPGGGGGVADRAHPDPAARSRAGARHRRRARAPCRCSQRSSGTPSPRWTCPTGCCRRRAPRRANAAWTWPSCTGPRRIHRPGPFDAVMERHVSWTLPDPVATMRAWRDVVRPGGRLVLFEGSWAGEGPWDPVKDAVAGALQRIRGVDDDHHAAYPEDVRSALPLGATTSPAAVRRGRPGGGLDPNASGSHGSVTWSGRSNGARAGRAVGSRTARGTRSSPTR